METVCHLPGRGPNEPIPVNKIIPISTVDGPGARTSVFLQGCNIQCLYCHNPETQQLCRHCGKCVPGCPSGALTIENGKVLWNDAICINCDQCIKVCPYYSSPKVHWWTAREVFDRILPNRLFIRGITVSGGEATLYRNFLQELFTLAQAEGLTTLIDANGTTDLASMPEVMAVTTGVMLDFKAWDPAIYERLTLRQWTGNLPKNILYLAKSGKLEELRLVYLDEYVDGRRCLEECAKLIPEYLPQTKLKLIKFRCHGARGPLENHDSPSDETMQDLREYAEYLGYGEIVMR